MHMYRKFVGVSLALFMSSFVFLSILQTKNDQEINNVQGDIPWGVNFHQQNVHVQSRDVMQARMHEDKMNQRAATLEENKINRQYQSSDFNNEKVFGYKVKEQKAIMDKYNIKEERKTDLQQIHANINKYNTSKVHIISNVANKEEQLTHLSKLDVKQLLRETTPVHKQEKPAITNVQHRPASNQKDVHIWPRVDVMETEDRIVEQLYKYKAPVKKNKTIVLFGGPKDAQSRLHSEGCLVQNCTFLRSMSNFSKADAVISFSGVPSRIYGTIRPQNQIWILFQLESPHHSGMSSPANLINWTATYRRDSVLVTPYEKFVHFANFSGKLPNKPNKNYAVRKSKLVAWFVSNCHAPNGRGEYVKELQKYIEVDIFGGCGKHSCPRSQSKHCYDLLNTDYKFYLAFENSNCKDYITEKLYWNALSNDIVPVVMGARPEDYRAVAPPNSYIHVDDFESPEKLAEYLHKLNKDDDLYNSYFRWKETGEFINTKFWCRVCNLVHAAEHTDFRISYKDLGMWWKGPGVCVRPTHDQKWATWRHVQRTDRELVDTIKAHTSNQTVY